MLFLMYKVKNHLIKPKQNLSTEKMARHIKMTTVAKKKR